LEKCVTLGKNWVTLGKMGHNWKKGVTLGGKGSHLGKGGITVAKKGHTWRNGLHLQKRVALGKICDSWENGSHLEKR